MIEQEEAADGEAADGSEGDSLGGNGAEVEEIGEGRRDCAGKSREIEPDWYASGVFGIAVEAYLQERCSKTDGSDDHDRERAAHGGSAGIEQHAG
jgi:hypothetical protein